MMRAEEVGVVVAEDVLQHGDDALEAHAGVDVLGRQLAQAPVGLAVVLDEDEVPELDVARAVAVDGADVAGHALPVAGLRAAIEMDLGARPARPRLAHLPEVLALEAQDRATAAESVTLLHSASASSSVV